ncbi:MAG: maleylpyruvate isomerase N-terminal domain-containing protein [Ferrimicrobium sp.]
MVKKDVATPSSALTREVGAFLEALDNTAPNAVTMCALWRAHEVVAHLAAGALEIALHLEAQGEGRPIPSTRSFEEREAPFVAMEDSNLRLELQRNIGRVIKSLDTVLGVDAEAAVPWTGRQMAVSSFVTHLRSEFALHRFDLVGDDAVSLQLLSQPEFTHHAVTVLGRALLTRGATAGPRTFQAILDAPRSKQILVLVDHDGARLEWSKTLSDPDVRGDLASRFLLLWGRMPGDPRRLESSGGVAELGSIRSVLAGY